MQAVGPAAAGHQATGVFVDDDDFAALHEVIFVPLEEELRPQGLFQVAPELFLAGGEIFGALGVAQRFAQTRFDFGFAGVGEGDGAVALVDFHILFGFEGADDLRHDAVPVGGFAGRPGDDEGCAGFVDEDVVDFVDDGVGVAALDAVFQAHGHVVAQVVEAEFVVGAVGDVGVVGFLPQHHAKLVLVFLGRGFAQVDEEGFFAVLGAGSHLQHADGEAEQVVDGGHPAGVAAGQVVVHGDEVHAFAHGNAVQRLEFPFLGVVAPVFAGGFQPGGVEREGVEVDGQSGD